MAKTKEKTFMDRWVEPSLAAPQASYQDHGGVPYGVLEHMQPLGEAPNLRVKARVRPEGARKSVLGRSAAAVGPDSQESPEGSPAPPAASSSGQTPVPIADDDDKDADYAPEMNGKRKERSTRRSAARRASQAATDAAKSVPKSEGKAKRKFLDTDSRSRDSQKFYKPYDNTKMALIVDAAMARARDCGRPDLALAMREIHQQCMADRNVYSLVVCVLQQTATEEQSLEYHDYVRAIKKKVKAGKVESALRQVPSGVTKNHTLASPSKLTLLPASHKSPSKPALPSAEQLEPAKHKISLKLKSSSKDPVHRLPVPSPPGRMSKSPRKRVDSVGSDSSLTSLTSNEEPDDMDQDDQPVPEYDPLSSPPKLGAKSSSASRGMLAPSNAAALGIAGMKRSSAEAGAESEFEAERDRAFIAKKQKLSNGVTRDSDYFDESNIRRVTYSRPTRSAPDPPHGAKSISLPLLRLSGRNARGSRAASLDADSSLSSVSSPQASPYTWKGPFKTIGKRAKTKQSPEKKHQVANSGMGGAGAAGLDSPIGDDDNNEELSENNDFCSACGGSGYLLCCDGCDRSFHFSCLDPPLSEDAKELDEPWFCYVCVAKRPALTESPEKPQRGLFAPLLNGLKKRNPANFMLPTHIRDYFEGVATDRNGNFIEAVGKPTRNRPGYSNDRPDYKKLRDAKGAIVQCYSCGLSSQGRREVISCDFCSQHWHLDCLDPPLSIAPGLNPDGFKVHDWMCPLHVDKELRQVDTGMLSRRKVHIRRPKTAKVFETALSRGFRNSGIIEVVDDDSDDSDSEFYDHDDGGTVYKLPASGIKLDFIDKVKTTRVQQLRDERAHKRARLATVAPSALVQANFAKRPFVEKQLALNLAQFARDNQDLDLGSNQVETLVGTLIAEAPVEVVREMTACEETEKAKSASSAIPPSPPASEQPEQLSKEQRKELRMLQELIRRKLEGSPT